MVNEMSKSLLIDELVGLVEHVSVHEYLIETDLVENKLEKHEIEKSINESHERIEVLRYILENNKSFLVCKDCYKVLTKDYCTCEDQMIIINTYNKIAKIPKGWLVKVIKDYGYQEVDAFLDDYTYDLAELIINQAIEDKIEINCENRPEVKIYEEQEYIVELDMGNPCTMRISIYHENQTQLTKEEIIEEARGYTEELDIEFDESHAIIETIKRA